MPECKFHPTKVAPLVARIEGCLLEPKSELRKRRVTNFFAEAKYYGIPLPALRALLEGRKRLRYACKYINRLPPHHRAEVAKLANAIGDKSELFQFQAEPAAPDRHLDALR